MKITLKDVLALWWLAKMENFFAWLQGKAEAMQRWGTKR